jgi:amylosucrase
MAEDLSVSREAERSLRRILPRLEAQFAGYAGGHPEEWREFTQRLKRHFEPLFTILLHLYGSRYDFFFHLEELVTELASAWVERRDELKQLDRQREADSLWFQSNRMLGGVCYVDLFAGDLEGVRAKIPYFKELGLTYLHLMPLFRSPEGENDGGYAISDYREVNPSLGTMAQLAQLADELNQNGISLVLDFVFNHTSNEHPWALKARAGDEEYQSFYRMYSDRQMPDAYEAHLREIFPEEHPGAFTYFRDIGKWVWTTFHSNQWDLNYANPQVFNRMAAEMLFLANQGVDVLRLDAVAFIWKQLGTSCENLPEAHMLIRAFNAVAKIAAPALIFKSEAIVHPDDVARYIDPNECQISYNPLLMALLWNTLATRDTHLLEFSMSNRFKIHPQCAWVNYVRSHDDIGWTFSDQDAAQLGIHGADHRHFLNRFFTGEFPGSFARGLPFQENPHTGDARISGTCASLAGLEKALLEETEREVELALRRILLIHSIILSIGGIPLIYLGDEIGTLNDYSYRSDPAKARDSRWVHRPYADWKKYELREDEHTLEGRLYQRLKRLLTLRKETAAFHGADTEIIRSPSPQVFGYIRQAGGERVLVLSNFSEQPAKIDGNEIRLYGLGYRFLNLINQQSYLATAPLELDSFEFAWLKVID